MTTRTSHLLTWTHAGRPVQLGWDEAGQGPTVLLLPALSSISTRSEMYPLMDRLAGQFHVVTIDWPGFGDLAKPGLDWTPDVLSDFLGFVLREVTPNPHAVIAAGHAATYALAALAGEPGAAGKLVSLSPTWRGPFPTMMKDYKPWFGTARRLVDMPVIGHALYALNLSRPVIDAMVRRHVYSDPAWLKGDALAAKLAVPAAEGARHASIRFVTGGFDRVHSREEWLALASAIGVPHLVVYGAETPVRSLAEIEALAALPGVEALRLPKGKLSAYEEFADAVAEGVLPFLVTAPASVIQAHPDAQG